MTRTSSSEPLPASVGEYAATLPPMVAGRLRKTLTYLYSFDGNLCSLGSELERRVRECGATVANGRLVKPDGSYLQGLPRTALDYAAWLAER